MNISHIELLGEKLNIKDLYLRNHNVLEFDTVQNLKENTTLKENIIVVTKGFHEVNDEGNAVYYITNKKLIPNEMNIIALQNDLFAILINQDEYINPQKYGAYFDGIHDDTLIIHQALQNGNVKFPNRKQVLINNLNMVEYRTLDLNYCEIITNSTAIICEKTTHATYFRDFTIKNGYFTNNSNSNEEFTTIHLVECIRSKIENCTQSLVNVNNTFLLIENSFNITINNVYIGNGNNSQIANTNGIKIRCIIPYITGTNNITNIKITNALIQNLNFAIQIDYNNQGSIDTVVMDNIGISNCATGILINGSSTQCKNIEISNSRAEFCSIGIDNRGYLTVNNLNINSASQIGFYNRSTGIIKFIGYIGFLGSNYQGFRNDNIADFSSSYPSLDISSVSINLQKPIVRPLMIVNDSHSTTDFSEFIHPIFDYQFNQTVAFEISDIPTTNVIRGQKLIITYNENLYILVYNGTRWCSTY